MFTVYDNDGDEVMYPTVCEVCPQCHGKGTSSAYLGAYTASEWAEQDDDFRDDYMAGRYDRTCDTCHGRNVIEVPDYASMSPELRKLVEDTEQELWEMHAMSEAERRAGC